MKKLINTARRFRDDESGAAMIEYTVLLGIITVAVIASVIFVGNWVAGQWAELESELSGV